MAARRVKESPLRVAMRLGTAPLVFAGVFSLVSNLLYLSLPIYTNQIYSAGCSISQSVATLVGADSSA